MFSTRDKLHPLITIWFVLCGVLASTESLAQSTPSLKQLEQQARERLEADKKRKQLLEQAAKERHRLHTIEQAFLAGARANLDGDVQKAVTLWEVAAAQGDIRAMLQLSTVYLLGSGDLIKKNVRLAVDYLSSAAKRGHVESQLTLGRLYSDGIELPRDESQAYQWFSAAASNGDAVGQYESGFRLLKGIGVDANSAAGLTLINKARKHGNFDARLLSARMTLYGVGIERNPTLAKAMLLELQEDRKLFETEDEESITLFYYTLGEIFYAGQELGLDSDRNEARQYFESVVRYGHQKSINDRLARAGLACLENGRTAEQCVALRCSISGNDTCPEIETKYLTSIPAERLDEPQPWAYKPRRGLQGVGVVRACVNNKGYVIEEPVVIDSSDYRINDEIIRYATAAKYSPGEEDGVALARSCVTYKVQFNDADF
jgi:TPR repeat protein